MTKLDKLRLQGEVLNYGEYVLAGAVVLPFDPNDDAETRPS